MKMFCSRVGTKVTLNTQKKTITATVRKDSKTSYGLVLYFYDPLKLTFQDHSSEYQINMSQSLNNISTVYCMNNILKIIKQYKKKVFKKKEKQTNSWNCRSKNKWSINGSCKVDSVN